MKNFAILVFTLLFAFNSNLKAEIVNVQKEEKKFGDWKVFCEIDSMLDLTHCKIGVKFFDNASSISVEPSLKSFSQFFIIIPKIKAGSFLQVKAGNNDLIMSRIVENKDFGLVTIDEDRKKILFNQMKKEDFLFLRFNINDSQKEATAKINLTDFRNALDYYNQRISR